MDNSSTKTETQICSLCCDPQPIGMFYRGRRRCKACLLKQGRKYYSTNKSEQKRKKRMVRKRHRLVTNEHNRQKHKELKIAAFDAYGGRECKWCGDVDISALSLDHVDNDGASHRRTTIRSRASLYRWLKKHRYPSEPRLQVLCMGCNWAKKMNGILPLSRKDCMRPRKEILAWQMI